MNIRVATIEDWERVIAIYNEAIDTRISTADTNHVTVASREEWLRKHSSETFPIYIWEMDTAVVGWCSLSPYRHGRGAFQATAEISYYVSGTHRGQGVATALIEHAISECPKLRIETLVAILLSSNFPSIKLLLKFGFEEWGRLPEIAKIDGNRYDHLYMGRRV